MASLKKLSIKLRKIRIENFKAIDSLELEFPAPVMGDEPDILVMGSKNGIGKTSVLESCALLLFGALWRHKPFNIVNKYFKNLDISNLLVRAGKDKATIEGEFVISGRKVVSKVEIIRSGKIEFTGNTEPWQKFRIDTISGQKALPLQENRPALLGRFWKQLLGRSQGPMLLPPLLYCHSFRKVVEDNPQLGRMVEGDSAGRFAWMEKPVSSFKLEIIRAMMGKAGLFENIDDDETQNSLGKLNFLLKEFAEGVIDKLTPFKDNTVDIRISDLKGTNSFNFDGLSSGQKEIISTLYLIWKYTRAIPSIVLIDEPELHLNYEWHSRFIQHLHKMAPDNQYIIATHSEKVFASAPSEKRVLLEPDNPPKRKKAKKAVSRAR